MFLAMASFFAKKITVYPFSAFEGQLFYKGEPAAHAKVTRTYDWDGTVNEETVQADAEGRFAFESVSVETKESLSQFVSSQEIHVYHGGSKYEIWRTRKLDEGEYGELGGVPSNITCEITDEVKAQRVDTGYLSKIIATNCHWEKINTK